MGFKIIKDDSVKKSKRKKHFANGIVVLCVITVIAYTVGCMWMKYAKGVEPSSTLTMCFFGVFGVELGSLAGIKMSKIRYEKNNVLDGEENSLPSPPAHSNANHSSQEE